MGGEAEAEGWSGACRDAARSSRAFPLREGPWAGVAAGEGPGVGRHCGKRVGSPGVRGRVAQGLWEDRDGTVPQERLHSLPVYFLWSLAGDWISSWVSLCKNRKVEMHILLVLKFHDFSSFYSKAGFIFYIFTSVLFGKLSNGWYSLPLSNISRVELLQMKTKHLITRIFT